jgi:hypothetical protein
VARAVLDDTIAGFEEEFGAVVEFEINLAGKDDVEIHGVGGVHAGVRWFEDFGHTGEFGLEFGEGGGKIGLLGDGLSVGRDGEKAETKTAGRREVKWMRGRSAVARQRRGRIGAPEAMEFEAGEQGEGDGRDSGVFGEDGFAGGVAAGDDAADVHSGVSPGFEEAKGLYVFSECLGKRRRIKITQSSLRAQSTLRREERPAADGRALRDKQEGCSLLRRWFDLDGGGA